jgi:hypothetical protein
MSDPINILVEQIQRDTSRREGHEAAVRALFRQFADWAKQHNVPKTNRKGWQITLPFLDNNEVDVFPGETVAWARTDGELELSGHARRHAQLDTEETLAHVQRQIAKYVHKTGHPWP